MGRLLRRYWWPIAGTSDLASGAVRPARLLGEDLALFRDLEGNVGLVDRHCAHRGADLALGFTEAAGLRCAYHGWMFDRHGVCQEAPYEQVIDPRFCERRRIRVNAYDAKEHGGLIWAYLGPQPAPELPDWEFFHWTNGFRQIVISEVPCNWLQCQENSVDPLHFEWQHSNYSLRRTGQTGPYFPKHLFLSFEEFEHGIIYRRLRETTAERDPLWRVGRVCLWPNAVFPGNHIEFRVPMDKYTILSVGWFFDRVPREREPFVQESIPTWRAPTFRDGKPIDSHVINQDFMAWIGQGECVDRGKEHLGRSDEGVAMLRRIFLSDMQRLEHGGTDPTGRDP
jgi:5,5'-dehydrodivanillate O-demethylase